ncbi:unnamed protein product [Pedinophyceae sp. YPF-701]|nr:unnamed protein product [Pedinophyceae sp. YPF-701]
MRAVVPQRSACARSARAPEAGVAQARPRPVTRPDVASRPRPRRERAVGCVSRTRAEQDLRSPGRRAAISLMAAALVAAAPRQPAHAILIDDEREGERVFDATTRSVVSITDVKVQGSREIFEGVGSGIVWDKLGHIVTNYHCVQRLARDTAGTQAVNVGVMGPDGSTTEHRATLVGSDPSHDLAVLRIDAPPEVLQPVPLGTSADLRVGQHAFSIGNPSGLQHTLSAGVVSGLNRAVPAPNGLAITGCVQTDASINAGSSGGALMDSAGRLIGVNVASFTRKDSGRGSGVNFAIASDTVREVVPNLIVYGRPGRTGRARA